MNSEITLLLPTPPGPLVSTTIKNSKFVTVHRTPLGPLPTTLVLKPGYYIALVEFPDGRCFEAAFQVGEGDLTTEVELEETPTRIAARSKGGERANYGPEYDVKVPEFRTETSPDDSPADPARADFSVSLVTIDSSGDVTDERSLDDRFPGTFVIEQGSTSRFVRIVRGYGFRDLYVAAPTSAEEGAEIRILSLVPLVYEMKLEDERANLLLGYIAGGRVDQLSELVADIWPKLEALADIGSERLEEFSGLVSKHWSTFDSLIGRAISSDLGSSVLRLFPAIGTVLGWGSRAAELRKLATVYQPQIEALLKARRIKPVTATVAGYIILLVGPPSVGDSEELNGDAIDLLTKLFFGASPWLSDQVCIRGELLARQGHHEKALSAFLQIARLGSPMFSMGLRYTLDRLKSYRNSALAGKLDPGYLERIEAALDQLQQIGAGADFSRPLLTFEAPVSVDELSIQREQNRSAMR